MRTLSSSGRPAVLLLAPMLLASLAHGAHAAPAPAPAAADGFAWDAKDCGALSVTEGARSGRPGALRLQRFAATLQPPPGGSGGPDHLTAAAVRLDGPPSLDPLPPLFAGGLMVGLQKTKPAQCDLTHGFERAAELVAGLPTGKSADQRWSALRIDAGENKLDANALHLHVESLPGDLMRVSEEVSGFTDAGGDPDQVPVGQVLIRVSAKRSRLQALASGGSLDPNDVVAIERIQVVSGTAKIDAHGTYHPATRTGHLDIRAEDMEAIRQALPASERNRVGAAMLILRLSATHDPDGALSWKVDWSGSSITVNGVTLPTSL